MSENSKMLDILDKLSIIEGEMSGGLSVMDSIPPEQELIRAAALTAEEQIDLEYFLSEGCPDLAKYDRARMLSLYLSGHDTAEIIKVFPFARVGGVAFVKAKDCWVEKRKNFISDLQYRSKLLMVTTKFKTLYTITSLLNAYNSRLETSILKYSATGDINQLPVELVPKNLKELDILIKIFKIFGDTKLGPDEAQPKNAIQVNFNGTGSEQNSKEAQALDFLKNVTSSDK